MTDPELAAMQTAYDALKTLPPREWYRALRWLANRLSERDRGVFAAIEGIEDDALPPQWFIVAGERNNYENTADEVVTTFGDTWVPIEVNGVAIVSQRWAVPVPISSSDDGETIDGHEIVWFDISEAADAYVAEMMAPLVTDGIREPGPDEIACDTCNRTGEMEAMAASCQRDGCALRRLMGGAEDVP